MQERTWIGQEEDEDGVPYFSDTAWEIFFKTMTEKPGSYIDGENYRAAREQLWAIREGLS